MKERSIWEEMSLAEQMEVNDLYEKYGEGYSAVNGPMLAGVLGNLLRRIRLLEYQVRQLQEAATVEKEGEK